MSEESPAEFRERIRSIGHLRGGLTKPRVVEGREHPETGVAFKAVTDENNNTVTEHATPDDRVDVHIRPQTVTAVSS